MDRFASSVGRGSSRTTRLAIVVLVGVAILVTVVGVAVFTATRSSRATFGRGDVDHLVSELAGIGIDVRAKPSDGSPLVAPVGQLSAVRLLRAQVSSLALERFAGSGTSAADLDAAVAAGGGGPAVALINGWAATANSAAAAIAREALTTAPRTPGTDGQPAVVPMLAVVAFLSDVTRPGSSTLDGHDAALAAWRTPASAGSEGRRPRPRPDDASTFCADVSAFVATTLDGIDGATGSIPFWLQSVITTYAPLYAGDPDLFRRTIGALALLTYATTLARPWTIQLIGDPVSTAYGVEGEDPVEGEVDLTVISDSSAYGDEIADCAALASAQFSPRPLEGSDVIWDPSGLAPHAVPTTSTNQLDDAGQASLNYQTATECKDAADPVVVDQMSVQAFVERKELVDVRDAVEGILLGDASGTPAGTTVKAIYEAMKPKLDAAIRPTGSVTIEVEHHQACESPSPSPTETGTAEPTSEASATSSGGSTGGSGGTDPCKGSCGGSNGDPHLRTIDGHRYEFQAAGEFVMLRAPDGATEIQARQEPACAANAVGTATCGFSKNTAIAVKTGSHRVVFTVGDGVPTVRVDGGPAVADPTGLDLGSGTTLRAFKRGWQLDLPDGSTVWVLSVGSFGINVLVRPSATLRDAGVGLLAHVPASAAIQLPPLPDGTTLPAVIDSRERHHQVYDVLAPAWRVTDATSLFDYATGQTTATFTLPDFPPLAAPASVADLDPAVAAQAQTACGGIADADLAEQCTFDVAATGEAGFVTLYAVNDQLASNGIATLDLAPGAKPRPTTGGSGAAGISLVDDTIAGIGTRALGPDGTVYVEIADQGTGFGEVNKVLLAIDPTTGAVKQQAPFVMGGGLVFVAGSLWADGFQRPDNGCAVARLDPATLAVRANIPTPCSDSGTPIVGFDGALWFIDPTGADASGAGGHLRRIDPTTNALDPNPSGSVATPFLSPFMGVLGTSSILTTTSDGFLIFSDGQHGTFRLAPGGGAFESVGSFGNLLTVYPAGDGVWMQLEVGTQDAPAGTAGFFESGTTPTSQVPVQGSLVAGDTAALYTSWTESDDQGDGLWRNPVDGGAPERLAVSGFEPMATGGTVALTYRDSLQPLIVGDGLAVKLWQVPSPTNDTAQALYVQAIPLP